MSYFGSFGETEDEALGLLMPVVDKVLAAQEAGDYEAFRATLTEEAASDLPEADFKVGAQEFVSAMGTLTSKKFMGTLKRDGNPVLLFAARFANSDNDVLIVIAVKNETTPPLVDSILFS